MLPLGYLKLGECTGASQPLGSLYCHRRSIRLIIGPEEHHLRRWGGDVHGGCVQTARQLTLQSNMGRMLGKLEKTRAG